MRLLRVAGVSCALLAGGCGGERGDTPRSLLLIVIDTLRADHLGCYGYPFDTSPTIDSLAGAGTRFDQVATVAPVTLPAVTSILTGLYPRRHGVRDNGFFALGPDVETLAERFSAASFRTGAVVASRVLAPDRGLTRGFQVYDADFSGVFPVWDPTLFPPAKEISADQRRAGPVTDRALEILSGFGKEPFFLLVHYFDVHHHYDPPPEHSELHPGRPYDGEIAYVDGEIARLLAEIPGGTLVVVVGDHGEGLGEHGEPGHGFLLHEATVRVPLVVTGPGVPRAGVRTDPVSVVDLEPTLARWFNLPSAGAARDGAPLAWDGHADRPLFSETFRTLVSYGWAELRAVRWRDWKLVRGAGDEELFHLASDRAEQKDLGQEAPYERLAAWLDEASRDDDPREVYAAAHGGTGAQSREMLESLGYTSVDPLPEFPEERPHPRDELPRWFDRQVARVGLRTALHFRQEGRIDAALAALDSTLILDPELGSAHALSGDCRAQLGHHDAAREHYRKALELGVDSVLVRTALARVERSAGRPEEAIRELLRVLAGAPDEAAAHHELGLALRDAGRPREARPHLARFVDLEPYHPEADPVRRWLAASR